MTVDAQEKTWSDVVEPIAERLEIAAKFGCSFTHTSEGCAALGQLLRDMGSKLDLAVKRLAGRE